LSNERNHYANLIIGTGQAGKPLARAFAAAGQRTALIERGHVGGTCINVGCTPTKAMVASARVAWLARRAADYGVRIGEVAVDLPAVQARKQGIVEDFRNGSRKRLEKTDGIELIFGEARFTGPHKVAFVGEGGDEQTLQAERIFINTGGRPARPPIDGLEAVGALDSSSILELDELPGRLVVLGGGYVGLEFAQMFRRFGSFVGIVQRAEQLVPREDEDVAEALAEILRNDGIEVTLGASVERITRSAYDNVISLQGTGPEGFFGEAGSHLLVATGRTPNTEALDLHRAGVKVDERGYIEVNERLETNVPHIWALGDVTGGPAFTHIAYDDYRIVEANLLGGGGRTVNDRLSPYTLFTDPELGRVGMSERQAREAGRDIRVAKLPMSSVARAIERSETRGFMKAIVDAKTDRILGCAVLGADGGEVMSVLQTAMMGDLPYTAIRDGVFAHPTLAESLNNLFLALNED
jgi:pyruvate/2-oxoglutarate dehydrogenase complex dihydrolipoamide dehydrogenase (E3) component